ncbi:MAG: hypothetical protein QW607_00800 [Desulfurococcaceae archaeon]
MSDTLTYAYYLMQLGIAGIVTKKDIDIFLVRYPKLQSLVNNYSVLSKKYGPKVVVKVMSDLLVESEEDVLSKLKRITFAVATLTESNIKLYIPYISEVVADAERRAMELGVYDDRIARIFDKLYDALHRDKPKANEIITLLIRVLTHVEKAEKAVKKQYEVVPVERIKRPKKEIGEDLIKDFVRMVYDFEKKKKPLFIADAINLFFSKHDKEIRSMMEAYNIYRECKDRGYIAERGKLLVTTDEGKDLIGAEE